MKQNLHPVNFGLVRILSRENCFGNTIFESKFKILFVRVDPSRAQRVKISNIFITHRKLTFHTISLGLHESRSTLASTYHLNERNGFRTAIWDNLLRNPKN